MKFIIVGDLHIRGDNPRSRSGNYYFDCKKKLQQIFNLANNLDATILQVGDVFNGPNISYSILSDFVKFLSGNRIINAVPGNHDIVAHNITTLNRTALGFCMHLNFIREINKFRVPGIDIIGRAFDHTLDRDYSEYITPKHPGKLQILVIHGMLLPTAPGFDMKHSTIERVSKITNADVIISGHYHLPFIEKVNETLFINPGALMRMSATAEEMTRSPQVVLLDTDLLTDFIMHPDYLPQVIKLDCQEGEEILDRSAIESNDLRAQNMQMFIESLDFTCESKFLNIQEILERCAKTENIDQNIVTEALQRISKIREERLKC